MFDISHGRSVMFIQYFGFSDLGVEVPFGFCKNSVWYRFGTNQFWIGSDEANKNRQYPI